MKASLMMAAAALAALACSAPAQPGASTGDGAPVYGGQLNTMVPTDPFDWDITYTGKTSPNDGGQNLSYNRLLSFKRGPDVPYAEQLLQPELAERWEVSQDAKSFTFHLRKGVKYADVPPVNGRDLTAADVKFSVEYLTRLGEFKSLPEPELSWMYEGIERVDAPDQHTAVIRFKEPFVPFIYYAASEWNPMGLAREIYQADGHFKNRIAGTGPFVLDEPASQKGTRWVWKKNPNYWDEGKPYLDRVRWLVLTDQAGALAAFQTKQLDAMDGLAHFEAEDIIKNNPGVQTFEYLQPRTPTIYTSAAQGRPGADVRVRKAVSLALDRDEFMKVVSGGKGQWSFSGSVAGTYPESEVKKVLRYDVAEAKRLLAQAGYANGVDLDWPFVKGDADLTIYELIQAQLKKAGINVQLKPLGKPEQRELRKSGNFDLDIGISGGQVNADADSGIYATYHSKSRGNYGFFKDPELDKLLESQRRETDPEKRKQLMHQAIMHIQEQAYHPALAALPRWDVYQPYVRNYYPHWSVDAYEAFAWIQK